MKYILDACCGSRMFWFDKQNPDVLFADNRELETTLCDGRTLIVKPDEIIDFRNMPYEDGKFKMVVFDPPHLIRAGEKSWLGQKYGILPKDWKSYINQGFSECMRVLEPYGTLIFKWNEEQIKTSDILKCIGFNPLFGDKRAKTHWMVFMKLDDCEKGESCQNQK
ncbi:MAG TPA: SAM-dependent methyltransferase [Chitinispirillaceae bacterium]|nr:SAM-dependent methyltransferase [Chitinispirillaceae bacterium]